MKAGKLPQDLLSSLLARLPTDPRLLVGPGIGRDAAAIDIGGGRVLVAKADPVTLAVDQIGRYAVHVNANDIACMGARPLWFLATVFLPENASPALAEQVFEQTRAACQELAIIPVGGHTEITIGIDRPIIGGAMLGEATVEELVQPQNAKPGDHVILANGIAVEGTAVLAREAPDMLRRASVPDDVIAKAAGLLITPGISVVRAARIACGTGRVRALHDPTEGGLTTALAELAEAAGLEIHVRLDEVSVLPETAAVCGALGLNPLGLLASGALLIAVQPDSCDAVIHTLGSADVEATCIANLTSGDRGAIIDHQSQTALPRFERDELARFFEGLDKSAER